MVFLLLMSVILGVRGQCPAQCRCPSSQVANCASLALTKLPTDRLDRYMQHLDISDNVIVSLDKTSLRDLGVISLVQLNASKNSISHIDEEAFLEQSKLQTVDLSNNSLVIIEPKTFIRNPSLEILSLSSNQDLQLPEEGSFLYSTSLRVLQLSACNLSHIPPNTFQGLPNLQELYIAYNKIGMLYNVKGVGHLTTLDISHNYLTDLGSDIFTALPELTHLNLSYNSLSTLNITVMPQLVKLLNSTNLNGNPWVCDCLMFHTIYSWCRNNSVDLELVCSSPPKFKGQPWEIYEYSGCDNDNTDFTDLVEDIVSINYTLAHERVAKYVYQPVQNFSPAQEQVQLVRTNELYIHISIFLLVAFLGLLVGNGILLWRLVRPSILRRSGPVHSDAETHHLSSSNI